ncbi:MAG: hypothetical protein ACK5P5_08335 [Pseudobdellovibrionaceae bacterium]
MNKSFGFKTSFFALVFLMFGGQNSFAVESNASAGLMQACLKQAAQKETANSRDNAKIVCLKNFSSQLNTSKCLSIAKGMAYFSNSNKAKLICGTELADMTPKKCLSIARDITYSETSDELKWTCIQRFKGEMSQRQCAELAKDLSLVPLQNRALEYCTY